MSNLIIGVSGCGGGNKGPAGLYQFLEKNIGPECKFLSLPTVPNDVLSNIEKVQEAVGSQLEKRQDIYLMGYSMGGSVVALSAQVIEERHKGVLKGVILLSSQTEGLQVLKSLDVPVLMIHGEQDEYFSPDEMRSICKHLPQRKHISFVAKGAHNLMPESKISSSNISDLAKKISEEVRSFFGVDLLRSSDGLKPSHKNWLVGIFN